MNWSDNTLVGLLASPLIARFSMDVITQHCMQTFYKLEPEVPGGWGDQTVANTKVHPPLVTTLHFEFDGWLGDALVESFPCNLVTTDLARELTEAALTGFEIREAIVTTSKQFDELRTGKGENGDTHPGKTEGKREGKTGAENGGKRGHPSNRIDTLIYVCTLRAS